MNRLVILAFVLAVLHPTVGQAQEPPIKLVVYDMTSVMHYQGSMEIPCSDPEEPILAEHITLSKYVLGIDYMLTVIGGNPTMVNIEAASMPLTPPGERNLTVAGLDALDPSNLGTLHYDIVLDTGYYCQCTSSEGGITGGEIFYTDWPWGYDTSGIVYIPVTLSNPWPYPGYEFIEWTGDPVDLGYVSPTAVPLKVTADYHIATGKHLYVHGLFGVITAPDNTLVSLPATPTSPDITLAFDEVHASGHTILEISDSGPTVPPNFALGDPPTYYDITTTASFSGGVEVCINYSSLSFHGSPQSLRLMHYEDGNWKNCTTSIDTANHIICGTVSSLSPFTIAEQLVVDVDIDIKPGSDPNPINQGSNGLVPVAILSSDVFDATQVDPTTVYLAGANVAVRGKGKYMAHEEDINGDGLVDLVVQVETSGFDEVGEDGIVILTAETTDGIAIEGSDVVVIVPPNK